MRTAIKRTRAKSRDKTFDAPVGGWLQSRNKGKVSPETATILDNWFPEIDGIRVRAGTTRFANIGEPVESMFSYESGNVNKIFAASTGSIFDISAPADTETPVAASVTGQTNGEYSAAIMSTAGGVFLTVVNGANDRQVYDGANWNTTPAITGVATSDLSNVWAYRNRLFFVQKDSLKAWFLPVESIGGAAQEISLAGVFTKGGSILFGATWSLDAGDGIDDLCVFVSTKGEVAVYQGNNPADPNVWALSGVYEVGPPLGPKAFLRVGGDLLIATEDGLVPMSSAVQKNRETLSLTALSISIEKAWRAEIGRRHGSWSITKWPAKNMAIVSFKSISGAVTYQFVVNLRTSAWARYTGWDVRATALFDDNLLYGREDGRIMFAERGGSDDGEVYVSRYVGDYDHLRAPARTKVGKMAQGVFISNQPFNPKIGIATDFKDQTLGGLTIAQSSPTTVWDAAIWDVATWDGASSKEITTKWVSAIGNGQYVAPVVEVAFSETAEPSIQLVATSVLYEVGRRAA